ncbi:MAG: hypothetical protein AABM31_10025 [Actinomycetota bacterium]
MEFIVILLFFGLSAGAVAKIKGGSFFLWFLIGFCLPFFGTIAALVSRNERATPLRSCPECGNVLPIHDQVCSFCGADLDFPEPEDEDEDEATVGPGQERLF